MDIRVIDRYFSVAPQITLSQLEIIKSKGYRAIVSNRFDGEEAYQPTYSEIFEKAQSLGLECVHFPVMGVNFTEQEIEQYSQLVSGLSGPTLAFCRSGTRSIALWAQANINQLDWQTRIKIAHSLGYDLTLWLSK